ncbi:MAG: hypothetical protein ACO20H_04350 [Bacteriovoracaceae bacterium]
MKAILIFLFLNSLALANEWDLESSGIYEIKRPTTLDEILIEKFKLPPEFLVIEIDGENLLDKIKKMNSHIKEWNPISSGSHLYLELPQKASFQKKEIKKYNKARNASHASSDYLKQVLRQRRALALKHKRRPKKKETIYLKIDEQELLREEDINQYISERKALRQKAEDSFPKSPKKKFGLFGFYAVSQGSFNEEVPSQGVRAENDQNSPFTLGAGFHFKLSNETWLSGSYYSSHLTGTTENELGESVKIPTETGMNFYYNKASNSPGLSFYGGVDKETFSTFNIDELQSGEELAVRNHDITYITAGLSHFFFLFNKTFLFKGSISRSIFSSMSPESSLSDKSYSGIKFITYLNYIYSDQYAFFAFWKNHNLSGATDVSINRLGLGLSITFY